MTTEQRENISRGRREGLRRKRLSEAMKKSWQRRRKQLELTFSEQSHNDVKLPTKDSDRPHRLVEAALQYLSFDELQLAIKTALIKKVEESLK